jgi:hypothetical protein
MTLLIYGDGMTVAGPGAGRLRNRCATNEAPRSSRSVLDREQRFFVDQITDRRQIASAGFLDGTRFSWSARRAYFCATLAFVPGLRELPRWQCRSEAAVYMPTRPECPLNLAASASATSRV